MQATLNVLAIPVKQELFTETVHLTGVVEYGVSWQALTSGQVKPPPEGARFDISFAGQVEGEQINGTIEGVDYLTVRADGRFMLDLHASITTHDGEKIAVYESGLLLPPEDDSRIARLQMSMQFTTASTQYAWMNAIQCWALGEVDWNTGAVTVQAYEV